MVFSLLEKSSLTEVQLDTILLSEINGKLRIKAGMRDGRKVTQGAFLRTLRQGQKNVESCLYTMFLLNYLGLIDNGDFGRLLGIAATFSKVKGKPIESGVVQHLLEAIEDVAKNFSGRKTKKDFSVI